MSGPTKLLVGRTTLHDIRTVRWWRGAAALFALSWLLGAAGFGASAALAGSTPCDCQSCHGDHHEGNPPGCSFCHDSPPQTGSHRVHYDSDPQTALHYGDTTVSSTDDAYLFGCGNCHPLDSANHRDGTVEVELYNAAAPVDSIKAKNPPDAAYDAGSKTCSNVYCHSGKTVATGPVGQPLTYPENPIPPGYTLLGPYIMDETNSNYTYDPYPVTYGREYAVTPAWGTSGSFTNCTECHQFPLTTFDPVVFGEPSVSAGAGDSHQWIDKYGFTNLHTYNMSYAPIQCRTCHYSTVTASGATHYTYDYGYATAYGFVEVVVYDPVPLASHAAHVNGVADVAFDTVDPIYYRSPTVPYTLSGASYDPAKQTCANVACHYNQSGSGSTRWQFAPRWGAPYRWYDYGAECDVCHRYSF